MDEGKQVIKTWGTELYYTNTDKFCGKKLTVNPLKICSRHLHKIKDEMFTVLSGKGFIEVNERIYYVVEGDHIHVPSGTWHRFWTVEGMELLEISTHHEDSDVERETKSDVIYTVNRNPIPEIKWLCPSYRPPSELRKE